MNGVLAEVSQPVISTNDSKRPYNRPSKRSDFFVSAKNKRLLYSKNTTQCLININEKRPLQSFVWFLTKNVIEL